MAEYTAAQPSLPSSGGLAGSDSKKVGPAGGRYAAMSSSREAYLVRARRVAGLTIPALFRAAGASGSDDEITAWQSHGARCVNNLASKMVLALFPPGRSFLRLKPSRKTQIDILKLQDADSEGALKAQIDKGLSNCEREFADCVEEDGDRAVHFDVCRHLIVGGNHCIQQYPDGTIRGVPLDNFTVLRDSQGNLLEFVICDNTAFAALPKDIQDMVSIAGYETNRQTNPKQTIEVYTHGYLDTDGRITVYQEVYGGEVLDSRAQFEPDYCPFLFLTMVRLKNEDYGRSYGEDYEGDLQAADSLVEIITTGSAAMARFIQLVRPGGMVSKKQLAEAENGDVLTGQEGDVSTVQANKQADFSIAQKVLEQVLDRLTAAFLLNSTVQRNAERVTAEEIRFVAQELEQGLGGVYANQVVTYQMPYGKNKLRACQKTKRVTSFPAGSVQVQVIAGMAAIGRNDELAALDAFMQGALATVGAQIVSQSINPRILLARRAAALGIDTDGLIYSETAASAQAQQAQQQQITEQFGPEIVKQLGQYLTRSNAASIAANAPPQGAAPGQPPQGAPPGPPAGGPGAPAPASAISSALAAFQPNPAPNNVPQAQPSAPLN